MTPAETLAFIREAGWLGSRPGLGRTRRLMELLGHPEERISFIHVAGTNGKGSVSAMLASILGKAGFRTGLFTSPHLLRYQERIRIDGQEINDEDLCAAGDTVKAAVERMADIPTEFERFTAMALVHFARKQCDIVVLETGMGGRLDSTNIIPPPVLSVITGVGLDHTEYLGSTLSAIAREKAGIIKSGSPVILAGGFPEAEEAVRETCAALGCPLTVTAPSLLARRGGDIFSGQRLDYRDRQNLRLGLLGTYQCQNAAVALDAADVLRSRGWAVSEESVRLGLENAVWPGRFEVLGRDPLVLVDGAHNPQGASALADSLRAYLPEEKITFVTGVLADKDYRAMLDALAPFAREFVTAAPDSPRALPAGDLALTIRTRLGLPANPASSLREALDMALETAGPAGTVCAWGSLYQAGQVRAYFGRT